MSNSTTSHLHPQSSSVRNVSLPSVSDRGGLSPAEPDVIQGNLPEGGKGLTEVEMPPVSGDLSLEARPAEALRAALEVFALTGYWVAFYKAVLGPKGVVAALFTTPAELDYFTGTREFDEIHQMLTALRTSDQEKTEVVEAVSMITIRIPKSLQASLVEEAKRYGTSMNKLCISKLLAPANPKHVPEERGRVRGRKPLRQNQ